MALQENVRTVIKLIDGFSRVTGWVFAWMSVILMVAIVYHVTMRYAFNAPTVWAYDVSYMLYGSMFMLGSAYCLSKGGHIRTDFIYNVFSPRWQGIIDATAYICLFFPALYLFFDAGWTYAERSWARGERGYYSPWAPPLYPFKTVIPVAIALLMLQGISELLKALHAAILGRWP